jgi:hypothetical protein
MDRMNGVQSAPITNVGALEHYWEKCPNCKGTGLIALEGNSTSAIGVCPVCNGEKIINVITGKPPSAVNLTSNNNFIQKRSWIRSMARKILFG